MAHSNHSVLGESLRLYTNAMGRLVKQRLETAFGDTWWEEAVIKTRSYVRWRQLEHDMTKDPSADKVTFLDPGTFVAIIDRNHAVFQDIFPTGGKFRRCWYKSLKPATDGHIPWHRQTSWTMTWFDP